MARLADSAPPACASCAGQYPDRRHVDFDAAFDGPVLDHQQAIQIDDLIVCEDCLREAFAVLELSDGDVIGGLYEQIGELEDRLNDRIEYADKLEAAIAARPQHDTPEPDGRKRAAA